MLFYRCIYTLTLFNKRHMAFKRNMSFWHQIKLSGFRRRLVGDDGNSDNSFAAHICNVLSEVIDCLSAFLIS